MLGGVRSVVGDDSETSFAGRSDGFDGVPESGETDWFSTLKFTTDDSGSSSESTAATLGFSREEAGQGRRWGRDGGGGGHRPMAVVKSSIQVASFSL